MEDARSPEFRSLLPEHTGPEVELHQKGVNYLGHGEWYDAIRSLRRAEAVAVTPALLRALGVSYYGARQFLLFRLKMEEAIQRAPEHFAPYYYLGRHYALEVSDWSRAIDFFRSSIERNPAHLLSHYYLGYAYEMEQRAGAAASEYQRALELARGEGICSALPTAGLARLLVAQGRLTEAQPLALQAVTCDPKDGRARSLLARILMENDRTPEALTHLETAFALDPADSTIAYQLYRAYSRSGRKDKAERMLGEVRRLKAIYGSN